MPPKKRGATAAKAKAAPAKRARRGAKVEEPEEEEPEVKEEEEEEVKEEPTAKNDIVAKLKAADKKSTAPRIHAPDKGLPNPSLYTVYGDYDCMLNQTNIGHNNNKFYIIQVLRRNADGKFHAWNRWGRVGENGQNHISAAYADVNPAIKEFEKKFKDKTKNDWAKKDNFVAYSGKYTLIEMDSSGGADEEETVVVKTETGSSVETQPSKLDKETQDLMRLIYDKDMFKDAMKKFDIDVKKMPLGKLSKTQIAKGFEILEEIETVLKSARPSNASLMELSSKFYTAIPHDFGRVRPPTIGDSETLQKKYDMLTVLGDIELAQSIQDKDEKQTTKDSVKPPHPLDAQYDLLKAKLTLVDKKSDEFKIIETYTKNTGNGYRGNTILEVWRVDREEDRTRFKEHDSLDNRKLLWHGTNVAVIVAILKTGLRIMPHSGGRVGRGIYFASENSKSAGYVGTTYDKNQNIGIMFLNEVALGKEHHITMDDCSLVKPPNGFDCVIAKGHTEPDPSEDTTLTIDGKTVVVPQGKPIKTKFTMSSFSQSEYLIYKESQNRIRYLLKMKF